MVSMRVQLVLASLDLWIVLLYHVLGKIFYVNTSEIAAKCIKMCGVDDIADVVAMRKDKFVKRYSLNSSAVCEIGSLIAK